MIKYGLRRLLLHAEKGNILLLEWFAVWAIYWGDYFVWGKEYAHDVRLDMR